MATLSLLVLLFTTFSLITLPVGNEGRKEGRMEGITYHKK